MVDEFSKGRKVIGRYIAPAGICDAGRAEPLATGQKQGKELERNGWS